MATPTETDCLKWHLWRAAIAIVVALMIQTLAAVYWGGSMSARMKNCEDDVGQLQAHVFSVERGD